MDSGLIQILVIAFFVIISLMDGAARKKRQENERRAKMERSGGGAGAGELFPSEPEPTSEGMVPDDLWDEIAALARGEPTPSMRRLPHGQSPEIESPSAPPSASEAEETWLAPEHQHVEEHDHVEWEPDDQPAYELATRDRGIGGASPTLSVPRLPTTGTARTLSVPAEALPGVAPEVEPGPAPRPEGKGTSVRRALMHGGRSSIRQAVILSEVLGRPLALRDSDYEPPG